jgi:UDP-N-acetylglucosamine acyltransferase
MIYSISTKARIDKSVTIRPYAIVEDDVEIGADTTIGSNVIIRKGTKIGRGNTIHAGAQIGVEPQDYHFDGEPSWCLIGDYNIIREYATISRATGERQQTVIGDGNFIMTYVHVAHNCTVGNGTVISSGTQIGGHVMIDDYVTIGGLCGIHQLCRVGKYAMLGAMSYLNKDLPPFLLARGNRARAYGLNTRGLRRYLYSWQEIEDIKRVYRQLSGSPFSIQKCIKKIKTEERRAHILEIVKFAESSKRSFLLLMDVCASCK